MQSKNCGGKTKQRKSRFNKNMFAYYEYTQNIYIFGKQHIKK